MAELDNLISKSKLETEREESEIKIDESDDEQVTEIEEEESSEDDSQNEDIAKLKDRMAKMEKKLDNERKNNAQLRNEVASIPRELPAPIIMQQPSSPKKKEGFDEKKKNKPDIKKIIMVVIAVIIIVIVFVVVFKLKGTKKQEPKEVANDSED